jgi:uncharacterized protein (TIGR02217 family)
MLRGICNGTLRRWDGFVGRSLLGYQTTRALGSPTGDSLKNRFTPHAADGDIYINSVWTSSLYRLNLRQDGTYWYEAGGDKSRQFILADLYTSTGLNGEGTLAINDDAPRPDTPDGTLFSSASFTIGQPLNLQLRAKDLQSDAVTFTVLGGGAPFPGVAINSTTGVTTGTPNTYGAFGFTVRLSDPYGAFSDSVEQVNVIAILPDFRGQLLSQAQAVLSTLGVSSSSSAVSSSLPLNTIITQSLPPFTLINAPGFSISFTTSNAATFTTVPNLFPPNLAGITFESHRSYEFRTGAQGTLPSKFSTLAYMQYPTIHWDLNYEVLNQALAVDELRMIEGLFNQKQGQAGTFLYLDPVFNTVTAEPFGTGDGTKKQFQLIAAFGNVGGPSAPEMVQNLQAAPAIFDNGSPVSTSAYTIGATGIVTFNTAPTSGHALTWAGSFYYLAQFETDDLEPSEFLNKLWELNSLKIKSVLV